MTEPVRAPVTKTPLTITSLSSVLGRDSPSRSYRDRRRLTRSGCLAQRRAQLHTRGLYRRPRRRVICLMTMRRIVGFLRSLTTPWRTFRLPISLIMVLAFSRGPTSLRGHSSGGLLHLASGGFLYMIAVAGDQCSHCNARRRVSCRRKGERRRTLPVRSL